MAHGPRKDRNEGVLTTLAKGLERGADGFTPARDPEAPAELPGRRRGARRAEPASAATAGASVILDCGTSRREGFTHVLWVAPSLESVLGAPAARRIGEIVGAVDGIASHDWERSDRLHVRAPGMDHAEVLQRVRAAVEAHAVR